MELLLIFAVAWVLTSRGFWQGVGSFVRWFVYILIIGWPCGWLIIHLGLDHLSPITYGIIGWSLVGGFFWMAYKNQ